MANITLSIDEKTIERARNAAQAMGTSLNQIVREHIERLSGADQRQADHDAYEARAKAGKGRLNGWKFNREEANARG
jgi:antitoxin component of RelBE/YafQ-DinJ toxin-antitoxin module